MGKLAWGDGEMKWCGFSFPNRRFCSNINHVFMYALNLEVLMKLNP